ncbi:hypothetical protein CGCF415_v003354 [Colletotrichum fructicola]|uniref:Uncharacterized protein n=5 Tax=Colletotrichum gloeosporioides species complex TaxID=2707338 RepID=L2FLT0_COLFN|nr:uncharacterized protein CGMCC3_g822 [Colletotrichum fructicola]XP_036490117.1 uncharacterized protein CGCS363_v013337 [Colletotrichum siamense]XP_053042553.1 uncharacterized protein COL26b_000538 [Colletotrichum chrysophilum]EQB48226.1 hypothetical protein CGLO_12562 [Colletotrichum gloeosporioides Cg-14]KAF0321463.1 hypothetical protein GQ607_011283 [Colletotrichum asianum]KAF4487184.1 hypothetical protein CGGC5_v006156 [Colletotrichum fructicola Nara gc5]KAF4827170.1 hypothetical protein
MSSTDSSSLGSSGEGLGLSSAPYTWILTPLIVFLSIGILATLIQFQRRRRLRRLGLQRPWPRRDLEANRQRAGGQRSSRNGRWAWTTRPDEGLDEFGEAPPAYEPKAKPGQAVTRDGSFEMAHVEHMPPPPLIGAAGAGRGSLPPDYGTATGSTSSTPPTIATPPTAVTRS